MCLSACSSDKVSGKAEGIETKRWSTANKLRRTQETAPQRTCAPCLIKPKKGIGEKKDLSRAEQQHLEGIQRFNNPVYSLKLSLSLQNPDPY
ncbi:hypothetical protein PBY51_012729 [Eleginops maclovinus]|uniref:Uncharacterized protein n=1 Tax=Eleginops maclovinus TaxID=56733 RepID=A0AAN8ATT3_ELEMC|nr:hypothetical protein PBY51_012729 [Eleginops maclovinus]